MALTCLAVPHIMMPAMKAFGCLFLLGFLFFLAAEIWVYILVSDALGGDYLIVGLLIVAMSFFGYKLMRWQAAKMPVALMQNRMGQQGVAVFGAMMIAFPGLISGGLGVLLQLPPIQNIFSSLAAKVVALMVKLAAERMGGQMPGRRARQGKSAWFWSPYGRSTARNGLRANLTL